ncbi:MAG: tetratricopeptide repeat protein [Mariprofundus sp.]|nr:tetratricopeptide repeat protein [Mariprofundus sp.]
MSNTLYFYCCLLLSLCCFSSLSVAEGNQTVQTNQQALTLPNVSEPSESAAVAEDATETQVLKSGTEHKTMPNSSGIDFRQIDTDYDIGRFEEALWALEDLQKLYPDNGEVLYRMGIVQEGMLNFDAAIDAYKESVVHLDEPSPAYNHLGELLYKMNKFPLAITAFEHVMQLKADSALTSYMLGMSYMNVGDFSASIQAYKRAGEIDASFIQKATYGQGISYIRMGQAETGQTLLREAIARDPESDVATHAKKSLSDAITLANTSYLSFFGLYGFQYDSNVVLKPSSSPNVPLITGNSDFEHTMLLATNYAPPPNNDWGHKLQTRAYANIHNRLRSFDIIDLGFTYTPYVILNDNNLFSMDTSFDYIFFNYNRYMDFISLKPMLTYNHNEQLQFMLSVKGTRENYYQPVVLLSSLQDGWMLSEEIKITGFSKDHLSSASLSGHYTTSRKRGTDWSYNAYGVETGFDVAIPYVDKLMVGLHGAFEHQKYLNWVTGNIAKRRDNIINTSASLGYQFTYVNVSLTGNYTHDVSTLDVYSYVRMMAGINISGSF